MDLVAPETRCIAELFAGHAALTFTRASRDQSGEAVRFKRRLIARAIGVLEERYGLSRDRAYQYLVRASRHSDLELTEVAREVVGAQTEQSSPSRMT